MTKSFVLHLYVLFLCLNTMLAYQHAEFKVTGTAESLEVTHRPGRIRIATKPEIGFLMQITAFARVARGISIIRIAKEAETRKFIIFCFFDIEGSSSRKPFTLAKVNPHGKAESESRPLGNHVL